MTTQSINSITYRGEEFGLYVEPLAPYLEKNQNISFDENWSTANQFKSFNTRWKIENSELLLTEIISPNQSINSVFNSDSDVKATWYSGELTLGFGRCDFNIVPIYEYIIVLKCEQGKISDNHIIKSQFIKDFKFDFGIFRGYSFFDLIGYRTYPNKSLPKYYLTELTDYFIKEDYQNVIKVPFFKLNGESIQLLIQEKYLQFLKEARTRGIDINFLIGDEFIAFDGDTEDSRYYSDCFIDLFEQILSLDFKTFLDARRNNARVFTANGVLMDTNFKLSYLKWAIKNVDHFCISPNLIRLLESDITERITIFKIERSGRKILRFHPNYERYRFSIPNELKKTNEEKFLNRKDIEKVDDDGYYILNSFNKDLQSNYPHLLYQKPKYKYTREDYEQDKKDYEREFYEAFEYDPSNTWGILD